MIKFSYDPFVRDILSILMLDVTELKLEYANAAADEMLQKSKDSTVNIINSGNTNTTQGGGNGNFDSGLRVSPKNNDISKYMLDHIGNVGGNIGTGFIVL